MPKRTNNLPVNTKDPQLLGPKKSEDKNYKAAKAPPEKKGQYGKR